MCDSGKKCKGCKCIPSRKLHRIVVHLITLVYSLNNFLYFFLWELLFICNFLHTNILSIIVLFVYPLKSLTYSLPSLPSHYICSPLSVVNHKFTFIYFLGIKSWFLGLTHYQNLFQTVIAQRGMITCVHQGTCVRVSAGACQEVRKDIVKKAFYDAIKRNKKT